MRSFNYTSRDNSGATKRGSLQAADRNAALRELANKGLVPLSVCEKRDNDRSSWITSSFFLSKKFVIAGVSILLGCVVWLISVQQTVSRYNTKSSLKKEFSKRNLNRDQASSDKKSNSLSAKSETFDKALPTMMTNGNNNVESSTNNLSATTITQSSTNAVGAFATATEQMISMVFNTVPGNMPPILPRLTATESNVLAILNRDIVLNDEDSARVTDAKVNVAYAKQELKKYMEQGGKPADFFEHYIRQLIEFYRERTTAQQKLNQLMKIEDVEGAIMHVEKANKALTEKGIRPLVIPIKLSPQNKN